MIDFAYSINVGESFFRSIKMHAFDGQTDGQTDRFR